MTQPVPHDAASFARTHAGERAADLTPAQRDLLGRVIARRIGRGMKLEAIARAAANALPELEPTRARRLGRDEALRALAWETLAALRAQGHSTVAISPAPGACPHCRAAAGRFAIDAIAELPLAGCTHAAGCRCVYIALGAAPASEAVPVTGAGEDGASATPERERPWYRKRAPRPHPPRWSEERREAARRARERSGRGKKPPRAR